MKIAEAFVEIRAESTKAEQDVRKKADSLGKTFAQVFGAAAFAAGVKKSIDAASDLNETVSKSKVIFGDASKEMERLGDKAAKSMGMSKRAYLDAAAGLKGLLDNLGLAQDESTAWSQDMTQLGSDLASFFNTDPADAIEAIGSALRGEAEPIRRYNVLISDATVKQKALEMGLYSGKGAIDANAKAQATLALIMEQTSAAQGDFARTADGAANAQRIAKAEIENSAASMGQNFLPIYQRAVEVVGFLAERFGELPAPLQVALVALAGVVALAGPIEKTRDMVSGMVEAFKNMGKAGKMSIGALGALGAVLTVASIAYSVYNDRKQEATERTNDLRDALLGEASAQNDALVKLAQNDKEVKRFLETMKKQKVASEDVAQYMREGTGAVDRYVKAWQKANDVDGVYPQLYELAKAVGDERILQGAKNWEDWYASVDQATINSAADLRNWIQEVERLRAAEKNTQATQELVNTVTGEAATATDEAAAATADYTSATGTLTQHLNDLESAFSVLLDTLDRRDSLRNMQNGFDDLQQAADDAFYAAVSGSEDAEQKARDYQQALDDQKRKVIELADEIGNVPRETVANILALIDEGKRAEAEAALLALERNRRVMFSAVLDPATDKITIGSLGNIHLSALGRYVDRPMVTAIGEGNRPEVVLPLTNGARMAELLGDPRVGGPVAEAMAGMGMSGATAAASSSGGGGMTVVNNIYGAERQYLTELMRRMDAIRAGG